jgi:hypothetical protein
VQLLCARLRTVRVGAQQRGMKMDFQHSQAERIIRKIKCVEEAIAFLYDAASITVATVRSDEHGQKSKPVRRLKQAEIILEMYLALASRGVFLRAELKKLFLTN